MQSTPKGVSRLRQTRINYMSFPSHCAVGIAWCLREHYPRFLEIMGGEERFPPSFDAWLRFAEDLEAKLSDSALLIVRVPIEPETFLAWREAHDLPADGTALDLFASEHAARRIARVSPRARGSSSCRHKRAQRPARRRIELFKFERGHRL